MILLHILQYSYSLVTGFSTCVLLLYKLYYRRRLNEVQNANDKLHNLHRNGDTEY